MLRHIIDVEIKSVKRVFSVKITVILEKIPGESWNSRYPIKIIGCLSPVEPCSCYASALRNSYKFVARAISLSGLRLNCYFLGSGDLSRPCDTPRPNGFFLGIGSLPRSIGHQDTLVGNSENRVRFTDRSACPKRETSQESALKSSMFHLIRFVVATKRFVVATNRFCRSNQTSSCSNKTAHISNTQYCSNQTSSCSNNTAHISNTQYCSNQMSSCSNKIAHISI